MPSQIEELYESSTEYLSFMPSSGYDSDEQIVILACLNLLEEYYELYQSLTPEEILNRVDDDIELLTNELSTTAISNISSEVALGFIEELNSYSIPEDYMTPDSVVDEVVILGLIAGMNQLRDDLKAKATYYIQYRLSTVFNIDPNFKRAINKISDVVGNNLFVAKEAGHRQISRFVYGNETLYRWRCVMDARTCTVCRALSREAPKPLDEWPYDHPHGRCTLEPVNPTYSEDYLLLLQL